MPRKPTLFGDASRFLDSLLQRRDFEAARLEVMDMSARQYLGVSRHSLGQLQAMIVEERVSDALALVEQLSFTRDATALRDVYAATGRKP